MLLRALLQVQVLRPQSEVSRALQRPDRLAVRRRLILVCLNSHKESGLLAACGVLRFGGAPWSGWLDRVPDDTQHVLAPMVPPDSTFVKSLLLDAIGLPV